MTTRLTGQLAAAQGETPALRVLLADDAVDVRLLVRLSLEQQGFDVVAEAANGAEAVALAEAHRPDVVLLDVAMPVMDGLQALAELSTRCPGVPVVMHSGFSEADLASQCLTAGAVAYTEKGGDPARLVRVLREAALGHVVPPAPRRSPAPGRHPVAASEEPVTATARPLALLPGAWGMAAIVLLFATVLTVSRVVEPGDSRLAVSLLYAVPIALLAARGGARAGALGTVAALALVLVEAGVADSGLSPTGLLGRTAVFVIAGIAIGVYSDRLVRLLDSQQRAAAAIVATNRQLATALEEARVNNEALEVANADLRQFGYIVSHDLAEPLRTMSGFSTLLESDYRDVLDERGVQYLDFIREGALRMRGLIDDLRAYTRAGQQDLVPVPVDLPSLVDDVVVALGAHLSERRAVVEHDHLPVVLGDGSMLTLVLQNLISNAVKFNVSERPAVRLTARSREGVWEVDVTDNGIGIDPAHHERVFGLFARLHTRDEYPGTGLGLAICKRILERHGGTISLAPTSAGTCVRLTLPAVPQEGST